MRTCFWKRRLPRTLWCRVIGGHRTPSILLLLLFAVVQGCSTLAYYAQSIAGQLDISTRQRPIGEVLRQSDLPRHTRQQLEKVRLIRDFASRELGLPDNDSYREYADLEREYVVWNVFAAPELSLKPREWCFLFVGCLDYRGYFEREDALQLAGDLQQQGFDVFTGGVAAYSTLGWFDDPVLNTMLQWNEARLAGVIFHELAHQRLYVRDDTKFNEAFAETVAVAGVGRWLEEHGTPAMRRDYETAREQEEAFLSLVFRYRSRLMALYRSGLTDDQKRREKARLLAAMAAEYRSTAGGPGQQRYDHWFEQANNASLLAVITYRDYLPGFMALLTHTGGDLVEFYRLAEELGQCPAAARKQILGQQRTEFDCRRHQTRPRGGPL